jgi:hypothetical protein
MSLPDASAMHNHELRDEDTWRIFVLPPHAVAASCRSLACLTIQPKAETDHIKV